MGRKSTLPLCLGSEDRGAHYAYAQVFLAAGEHCLSLDSRARAQKREREGGDLWCGVGHGPLWTEKFANCAADRRQHVRVRGNFST